MFYYTLIVNDKQYWVFENNEIEKSLEGSFRLSLTNLEDEFGKKDVSWSINLHPDEKAVKTLMVPDIFQKCLVNISSTYIVK